MIFNSLNYILIFLPFIGILYYQITNQNYRNFFMIIASFYFYAWGNPLWLVILIMSSSIDFSLASKINQLNLKLDLSINQIDQKKYLFLKKFYLCLSIIFNCLILLFFKYWDWLMECLSDISNINFIFLKHNITLPPAISFYTFESLSYIIDIYRRKFQPTKNFFDYLTFIAFFPKLVAGPIMRAHELTPQVILFKKKISSKNLEFAIFLILWGLFKKIVFADNLGHLVDISKKNLNLDGVGYIIGIASIFQIYCDFSGYCDIARGSAKLFCLRLTKNFNNPLLSSNTKEFFSRWNISLGTWIRDYVYIPMKGSKCGFLRQNFNLFFTMFLFGIWHGASWYFALYGIYGAFLIMIYRITKFDLVIIKIFGKFIGKSLAIFIHINLVFIMSLIFYCKNINELTNGLTSFFNLFNAQLNLHSPYYIISFGKLLNGVIIYCLPILILDIIGNKSNREFVDLYPRFNISLKIIIYVLMFYLSLFFYSRGVNDFIYFQF